MLVLFLQFHLPDFFRFQISQSGIRNSNCKSFERNVEEASKWPPTYAELSKSGCGVHLHYIYTGDPARLSRIYDDHVEVKVRTREPSSRLNRSL